MASSAACARVDSDIADIVSCLTRVADLRSKLAAAEKRLEGLQRLSAALHTRNGKNPDIGRHTLLEISILQQDIADTEKRRTDLTEQFQAKIADKEYAGTFGAEKLMLETWVVKTQLAEQELVGAEAELRYNRNLRRTSESTNAEYLEFANDRIAASELRVLAAKAKVKAGSLTAESARCAIELADLRHRIAVAATHPESELPIELQEELNQKTAKLHEICKKITVDVAETEKNLLAGIGKVVISVGKKTGSKIEELMCLKTA